MCISRVAAIFSQDAPPPSEFIGSQKGTGPKEHPSKSFFRIFFFSNYNQERAVNSLFSDGRNFGGHISKGEVNIQ